MPNFIDQKEKKLRSSNLLSVVMQDLAALMRTIPLKPIEFAPGEISTQPESISIFPTGRLLRIQPNLCALVTHPSGRVKTYTLGTHYLNSDIRDYTIQYFDMRQQNIKLPEIRSISSDAWDVMFTMELFWQVRSPLQIVNIPKPKETIESICFSTVIDFIRTNHHDAMVSTPGRIPLATAGIANQIHSALSRNTTLQGIEIIAVLIMDIKGDQRRTEVVQKSTVRKTEIEQEVMIQREQARLAGEKLALEKGLADQNQSLAVKKAETKRLEEEEEESVRVRKAEITAIEAKTARDAKIQEVEIQRLAEQQRMQHEQILKAMDVRSQAFGQLAGALLQTSSFNGGIQRGSDGINHEAVGRALEMLATMPPVSFNTTPMLPAKEETHSLSFHDGLIRELHEVHELPGAETVGAREIRSGFEQVEITYLNLQIYILCNENYPFEPPEQVMAKRNGDLKMRMVEIEWSQEMNLRQIVLIVASKLLSSTNIEQAPKKNDNSKKPASLAG